MKPSPMVKHSVTIGGRQTSISLEQPFWAHLKAIAAHRNKSLSKLVSDINRQRDHCNRSSAIRLFVLNFVKEQIEHGKVL